MKLKIIMMFIVFCKVANAGVNVLTVDKFNESYSGNIKVSGEYIVGLQLKSRSRFKNLHVLFRNEVQGVLCVSLSSIDGKYKAKINYPLLKPVSGWVRLKFKSDYNDVINKYANDEIAIFASVRQSCESTESVKYLISSWSEASDASDLVIFIRSDARRDIAYVPSQMHKVSMAKCKKIRSMKSRAYDKSCVFSGVDIGSVFNIELISKNLRPAETENIVLN